MDQNLAGSQVKVTTLWSICKKCGQKFNYNRVGKLTGRQRLHCDDHFVPQSRSVMSSHIVEVQFKNSAE